jgi:hypothetical protein
MIGFIRRGDGGGKWEDGRVSGKDGERCCKVGYNWEDEGR